MAGIKDIQSPVWAISTVGYGVIVEGVSAIRQRIDLAIRTTKGTDPLRPEFGSRVYKYVDAPVNVAVPNVKKELLEALGMWVPEIKVISINHYFEKPFNPIFEIVFRLVDEELIEKILFDLRTGTTTITDEINEIILQAFYPPNPNNYRYKISLIKNGSQVAPLPPPYGFETINELFDWINSNWAYLGRWHKLADRIICYMSAEGVVSASLSISVVSMLRIQADFPLIIPTYNYLVVFSFQNDLFNYPTDSNSDFNDPGSVLAYAQSNWSFFGDWFIEYIQQDGNSIFSDEFSDEFAVASTGYRLVGVSFTEGVIASLEISIVKNG